jgi:prepilin signal peptidase PulO-like enzyme (type II secretory pathway)
LDMRYYRYWICRYSIYPFLVYKFEKAPREIKELFCYNIRVTLVHIFVFIFGTIIGSFLNVVICRHGTGRSLGGRSKCAVTGKTIKWFELIPIVSFLAQGGRSRYSKTKISWQYPLVEFFTGLSFLLVFKKFLPILQHCSPEIVATIIFYFTVFSLLILIFVYDLRHKVIPDSFLYPLMILSFAGALFLPFNHFAYDLLLAGPIVALPMLVLWLATRGKGMGFGDVFLVVPFGWLLGTSGGFASLLFSFWIGAVAGIILLLFGKKKWKSEIPFGPFLILGFVISFLYNIDMNSIANFFARLI